jgi:threonine/homoserine efflux transporter RhtA
MNQCFYQAIARIPSAPRSRSSTSGPFMVAALGKRSWRHFAFVALAGLGVVALTPPRGGTSRSIGRALRGSLAGAGWATYALRVAPRRRPPTGFGGLAVGDGDRRGR